MNKKHRQKVINYLKRTLNEGINVCNEAEIAANLKVPFMTVHAVFDELVSDGLLREYPILLTKV